MIDNHTPLSSTIVGDPLLLRHHSQHHHSQHHQSQHAPSSSSSSPSSLFCIFCCAQVAVSPTTHETEMLTPEGDPEHDLLLRGTNTSSRISPPSPVLLLSSAPHPSSSCHTPSPPAPSCSCAAPPRSVASEAATRWLCFPRTCYCETQIRKSQPFIYSRWSVNSLCCRCARCGFRQEENTRITLASG